MALTALAFLGAYGLGLLAALARRPVYGLYVYVATFYLHPPSRWWGDYLPDLRWSLIAAAVTLVAIWVHKERDISNSGSPQPVDPILKILFLYSAWMWVQVPWAVSNYTMEGAILFSKYVLLVFLLTKLIRDEKTLGDFCLAHVVGCIYFGWLVYAAPDVGRLEGVGGPGVDNSNSLGMHLSTGLIFAGILLMGETGWRRLVILLGLPLILNGVIQTEARAALVGLFCGAVAITYLKPRVYRTRYYVLAVLAVFAFLVVAPNTFWKRMSTLTAAVDEQAEWDSSAYSRIEIAKAQLKMFKDHPLGVGHWGTTTLSRRYIDEQWWSRSGGRSSHNTVLSVLVDQGIPGIALFGILGMVVVRRLRRLKHLDDDNLSASLGLYRAAIGGALAVAITSGMFTNFLKAEVQIWCLALLIVLSALARINTPSRNAAREPFSGAIGSVPTV